MNSVMSLFDYAKESQELDKVLDAFETYRKFLLTRAKEIALELFNKNGKVTSPEVVRILEVEHPNIMSSVDHRFMGGVFRKDWQRIGFVSEGSHCQPISVWIRK